METEVLAIIQARGGSKRLPRKNVRSLGGHPLIAYSITSAHAAERVTRTIVSTDDPEIAKIAKDYGAEVPFMRPEMLARDDTADLCVLNHALQELKNEDYVPEAVVQLRPTSPLRPSGFIDKCVAKLFANPEATAVKSVVEAKQHPYFMWKPFDNKYIVPFIDDVPFPAKLNTPTQKLPKSYWFTGDVDVIRYWTLVHQRSTTGYLVLPVFNDVQYVVDIDTYEDFERAKWQLEQNKNSLDLPTSRYADD